MQLFSGAFILADEAGRGMISGGGLMIVVVLFWILLITVALGGLFILIKKQSEKN